MIHAYRARGHRIADTDPLGASADYFPELDPGALRPRQRGPRRARSSPATCRAARSSRCARSSRGCAPPTAAASASSSRTSRTRAASQWLMRRMEETENTTALSNEERLRILEKLSAAELFERFLHTRVRGPEALLARGRRGADPAARHARRGVAGARRARARDRHGAPRAAERALEHPRQVARVDLLASSRTSSSRRAPFGSGDVKYHKGFSQRPHARAPGADVHLSLTANPSHLEAVDPVVEGRARAKQARARRPRGRHDRVPC